MSSSSHSASRADGANGACRLLDLAPTADSMRDDVLRGLRQPQKRLPCKYFYDERGSLLFDQICELDEYYLTRTELALMRSHAAEMAAGLGAECLLIEFGSGSSLKTDLLLSQLQRPAGYMPVDIARDHLENSARRVADQYPDLRVLPVCADFTQPLRHRLPQLGERRRVVYFPGSTLGNFEAAAAAALLHEIAAVVGRSGGLLIGLDLQKDAAVLRAAYDDARGITAEFNLNILRHINRRLGADFQLPNFEHRVVYDAGKARIEMYLVSRCRQRVRVGGESFDLADGEAICTEYSHKYRLDAFEQSAASAGFRMVQTWTDARDYFAVGLYEMLESTAP